MLSITATELPRFLACNGFVSIGAFTPVEQDTTERDKGIAAHWFAEQCYKTGQSLEEYVDRKTPNGFYVDEEMVENTRQYLKILRETNAAVETDTSWGEQNFTIRGRADAISLNGTTLNIYDYKYGWRIVEPDNNWTMISHAIGWLRKNPQTPVDYFSFTIVQPRPFHPDGNVRTWVISERALAELVNNKLFPVLRNPSSLLNTGSHCHGCDRWVNCPAIQKASMNAIEMSEEAFSSDLNNEQLSYMLTQSERALELLKENIKAFSDLAFHRVKGGQIVPNYAIEKTATHRKWKEGVDADLVKLLTGIDVSKKELITPKQAETRGIPVDVVNGMCERSNGGFKLVRSDSAKKVEKILGAK